MAEVFYRLEEQDWLQAGVVLAAGARATFDGDAFMASKFNDVQRILYGARTGDDILCNRVREGPLQGGNGAECLDHFLRLLRHLSR